jgi:hypothetical protein
MINYLWLVLVVFACNVVPAFAPPTWTILVLFRFQSDLHAVPLVILGAVSAATGRFFLAHSFRALRTRLPKKTIANLASAREVLIERGRGRAYVLLGLFLVSPFPSAQLFEAAGLLMIPLPPLMLAFMCGRLFSYSMWVGGATALKNTGVGDIMKQGFASPWAITLQVVLVVGVIMLTQVNWSKYSKRPPLEPEAASD